MWGGGAIFEPKTLSMYLKKKKKKKVKKQQLELMFMKHYAPNRCLYIKMAKLRTGVGKIQKKKYFFFWGGGRGGGGRGSGRVGGGQG